MRIEADYLVIGSGVAGLTFALEVAQTSKVIVVTKGAIKDTSTAWAQGGVAAVMAPDDSFEDHTADTLSVGYGINKPDVVRLVVEGGPKAIDALMQLGAKFDEREEDLGGGFDLTKEGGHHKRRVLHAGDITGREIQNVLTEAVAQQPNIVVKERHMGVDLIELSRLGCAVQPKVVGAYVLSEDDGEVHTFLATRATVLATGGAGKVYLYTSNPDVATGDGVAMAYRAGCVVSNMEFFQFHPTCLYHPQAKNFLISEALRGEGGILRLADGDAFMVRHHEMKDLAPRDVVARSIDFEMKRTGANCVYLDMTHKDKTFLIERFPNIYAECMKFGIDLTTQQIPVVPAAHYMCGGVVVDEQGATKVPGLWAIGEVTCTGLHGANRLASNSLLEGMVMGHRVADYLMESVLQPPNLSQVPEWKIGRAVHSDEAVVISQNWDEIRRFMWNYVGVVRSNKRLKRAARRIALLKEEIREYYWEYLVDRNMLELRNIADVAEMIISCAMARRESRGLHYTLDHPETDDHYARDIIIQVGHEATLAPFPMAPGSPTRTASSR